MTVWPSPVNHQGGDNVSPVERQQVSEAINNPTKVFTDPMEVVSADGLSRKDKLKILESWEQEARLLQVATGENMSGGEPSRIEDVRKAIDSLVGNQS